MGFETLNFSTKDKIIPESIQSKIDSQKLKVSQITKENLKNLRVVIIDKKGTLNIRDERGNIIGKLKDSQKIAFNGEKRFIAFENKARTLLGLDLDNGEKGYIAASYVVGDVVIAENDLEKNSNQDNDSQKIENNQDDDLKRKQEEERLNNQDFQKFKDILIQKVYNPRIKMIMALSNIWLDGAQKALKNEWSLGGLLNGKEIIENGINSVNRLIIEIIYIINDKNRNIGEVDEYIDKIFEDIFTVEKNGENIIDKMDEIKNLFVGVNNENYEERLAKLLSLSSGGFRDGNTQKSKEIAKNIIIKKYFSQEKNKIDSLNDISSITSDFFKDLGIKDEKICEELKNEVKETYNEVFKQTNKNRKEIEKEFDIRNPDFSGNKTQKIEEIIRETALIQSKEMIENRFLEYSTKSLKNNPDKILDTYNNLNSNWQVTKEWLADNGLMIAISLIPVSAGLAAVGIASKGVSMALRGKTLLDYGNKVRVAGNALKGVTFYEGMNFTNNLLYQDSFSGDLLNGSLDSKELIKNALFFNIMGIVGKYIPNGENIISVQTMKSISAEVFAFTGVNLGSELGFEKEISIEDFKKALLSGALLSIASKGIGKISNSTRGTNIDNLDENINNSKPSELVKAETKENINNLSNELKQKPDEIKIVEAQLINRIKIFEKNLALKLKYMKIGESFKLGEITINKVEVPPLSYNFEIIIAGQKIIKETYGEATDYIRQIYRKKYKRETKVYKKNNNSSTSDKFSLTSGNGFLNIDGQIVNYDEAMQTLKKEVLDIDGLNKILEEVKRKNKT